MLRFKHLIFFGPTGSAKWRGQIYGTPRFSWFINRPIIYHGTFGEGFFNRSTPPRNPNSRLPEQRRVVRAYRSSYSGSASSCRKCASFRT
jgi:hypothetical protein